MIELLSPQIANQIAAGEVVQRPASAVKELLENAVDAGARRVSLECVDGGRTALSVVDDGVGMDSNDAQKAFLRHATSKIRTADDLFHLRTFGFRGEALASIASVAEVELRTRRVADDIGTRVVLSGGEVLSVDPIDAPKGTAITVRNLFFNVPARRKFLKSDRAEAAAVWNEFVRVAMVNPDIEFTYKSNIGERETLVLPAGGLLPRVVGLTKAGYAKKMLPVDLSTDLVRLTGYVGMPETATVKSGAAQYLFVNGRYVRSAMLGRAVVQAYDRLVAPGSVPAYFLFLELSPEAVDVNINPTKTEVKFEDDAAVFQTLYAAVKACLGKANAIEAMDFNELGDPVVDIPTYVPARAVPLAAMPPTHSGKAYTPFAYDLNAWEAKSDRPSADQLEQMALGEACLVDVSLPEQRVLPIEASVSWSTMVLSARYMAVRTAEGLALVDVPRACHRIEYERTVAWWIGGSVPSQGLLIPQVVELDAPSAEALGASLDLIESLGFVVARGDKGWELHAAPESMGAEALVAIAQALTEEGEVAHAVREELVGRLAERACRGALYRTPTITNPNEWIGALMRCNEPSFTPSGLKIIETVEWAEIERRMV